MSRFFWKHLDKVVWLILLPVIMTTAPHPRHDILISVIVWLCLGVLFVLFRRAETRLQRIEWEGKKRCPTCAGRGWVAEKEKEWTP